MSKKARNERKDIRKKKRKETNNGYVAVSVKIIAMIMIGDVLWWRGYIDFERWLEDELWCYIS